jgi:NTP pyrophosphatase (non-canonical NTP hydrolase)
MTRSLKDFQKQTQEIINRFNFNWSTYVQYIHLVEEVAELGEAITVNEGDRKSGSGEKALADHSDLTEEIGDALFSVIAVANKLNIDSTQALEEAFKRYQLKLEKLNKDV